jgi:hypothetical protein
VLGRKEEGGNCVLLLYLSSITHLQTHEYSCEDNNSRYILVKLLIKWNYNLHIHLIQSLILREKLTPFPRTFHVLVLKRRHQLKFAPRIWSPKLPVALNILLDVSKFKFACKITFRALRYFCSYFLYCLNTRHLKNVFVVCVREFPW